MSRKADLIHSAKVMGWGGDSCESARKLGERKLEWFILSWLTYARYVPDLRVSMPGKEQLEAVYHLGLKKKQPNQQRTFGKGTS